MQIMTRKNDKFNLAVTFIESDGKVIRPKLSYMPTGLFKDKNSFQGMLGDDRVVSSIKHTEVEAATVDEVEAVLDREEQRLLNQLEGTNRAVES